jgi:hypothetical protein
MTHGPKTVLLATTIAALLSAPALAGGHPDRAELDTNKDGQIDLAEIQAVRPDYTVEKFNAADTNRDGQLSADEWPGGHRKHRRYGNLDADKDGHYTLEELRAAHPDLSQETYASFDSDSDGKVSRDEVKVSVGDKLFENMDADGNGGISESEMRSVRSSVTAERFQQMDADGNGLLSKEELRAAHRKHRRHGDGPEQKPAEPPNGG